MFTRKPGSSTEYAFTNAVRDYSGTITCDVTLESTGEVIPFTASPDDEYDYGRDLYEQLNTTDLSSVTPYTDADRLAQDEKDARSQRNTLLKSCDWTQGADVPVGIKTSWQAYRQDLRDVPAQVGFPTSIVWPTEP